MKDSTSRYQGKSDDKAGALSVAVDARCLNTVNIRGMGKYVQEIITHMPEDSNISWTLIAERPDLPFHPPAGKCSKVIVQECRGYRFHAWEQWMLPRMAKKEHVSVLHCVATTLPIWQPVPTVVTVHDALYWKDSASRESSQPNSIYWNGVIPRALRIAKRVITISKKSKQDILEIWPELGPKLHVITHGVADRYFDDAPTSFEGRERSLLREQPYILYVGGILERKRFTWALEILREVIKSEPRLILAACGFSTSEAAHIATQLPMDLKDKVTILPFIDEENMPTLYRRAVAVLYPTLYEGFGLPVIESIASGTPIIFSPLGSLAELRGPGAIVVAPHDLKAWVDGVVSVLGRKCEQPNLCNEGRRWAQRFSWHESAKKHLEIYRDVSAMQ